MKKPFFASLPILAVLLFSSCFKDPKPVLGGDRPAGYFESLDEFYNLVKPRPQVYSINNQTGGSFTTTQGTVVTVPANIFVTQSNGPVTGMVNIEFLDVFKKSDMLYLDMGTEWVYGGPLKSTGEFFIRASQNNVPVILNGLDAIQVELPAGNVPIDTAMAAFDAQADTAGQGQVWWPSPYNSLLATQTSYIFSLYQFSNNVASGTWCNSDQPSFANAPQTNLILDPTQDPTEYNTDVFIFFTGVKSMVHVYANGWSSTCTFPYPYAPLGYQATVVAIGTKDGKLYSSFTPITISANQTLNFTLSETTSSAFQSAVQALN